MVYIDGTVMVYRGEGNRHGDRRKLERRYTVMVYRGRRGEIPSWYIKREKEYRHGV